MQRALFRIDQVVHPGGHDEVVAVQAANGVGPPLDGDLAPFQEDGGVVIRLGGEDGDLVGELDGRLPAIGFDDAFESLDALDLDDVPTGDAFEEGGLLFGGYLGCAGLTGFTAFGCEVHG